MNCISTFSGFSASNINAAKEFYVSKLGLALNDDTMGLDLGLPDGGRVFIYEKPDHVPAEFTVLNFVVQDIDVAIDELIANGISLERYDLGNGVQQDDKGVLRGKEAGMGPDIAWFKDPAGNVLSVLQD